MKKNEAVSLLSMWKWPLQNLPDEQNHVWGKGRVHYHLPSVNKLNSDCSTIRISEIKAACED